MVDVVVRDEHRLQVGQLLPGEGVVLAAVEQEGVVPARSGRHHDLDHVVGGVDIGFHGVVPAPFGAIWLEKLRVYSAAPPARQAEPAGNCHGATGRCNVRREGRPAAGRR